MDLLKYAAKLGKMSTGEVSFRLRQKARNTMETLRWKRSGRDDMFIPAQLAGWDTIAYPFPLASLKFFGLAEDRGVLRRSYEEYFPAAARCCRETADQLLEHRFLLLGLSCELPDPIPWNRNPQTGSDYPMQHHMLMDTFNTDRYGDVKFVWELNRHQFFIEIAKAWYISGDERYAVRLWEWMDSWFDQNPHKIGINHTSVLEHAVRIYSWVWSYYFTAESPVWTAERRGKLARNLLLQGEMIEENLSFYYSPYNHLIGELAALALLGTVYANSPRMIAWRDTYWAELEAQLDKQYHQDGFTVEQASYYHHFTTGFYLMLAMLRRQNGLPVSQRVWDAVERALAFPMALTRPDGQLPMLGDIDSARSLYFYQPDPQWDLRAFQALGAVVFKRADMRYVAGGSAEELLWLLGSDGMESFRQMDGVEPQSISQALPESGYWLMRDGWHPDSSYCCFDCGEIADGVHKDETPSAAHGHGDILSFELTVAGKPLIIDPGFNTYFGPLEWHRYFRSTRGHNAIELDGAGQAQHEGRIGWSRASSASLNTWVSGPELDLVSGRIDRFAGRSDGAIHQRSILFRKKAYALVIDHIYAPAGAQIESSLHFAPGELIQQENKLIRDGAACLAAASTTAIAMQLDCGGEGPDKGWMAVGYGWKAPAPVLRITTATAKQAYFAMLFPFQAITPEKLDIQLRLLDDLQVLDVCIGNLQESVWLNPAGRTFTIGESGWETDALCVVQKIHQENELQLIKLRHLERDGETVDLKIPEHQAGGLNIHLNYSGKPDAMVWGS